MHMGVDEPRRGTIVPAINDPVEALTRVLLLHFRAWPNRDNPVVLDDQRCVLEDTIRSIASYGEGQVLDQSLHGRKSMGCKSMGCKSMGSNAPDERTSRRL